MEQSDLLYDLIVDEIVLSLNAAPFIVQTARYGLLLSCFLFSNVTRRLSQFGYTYDRYVFGQYSGDITNLPVYEHGKGPFGASGTAGTGLGVSGCST